MTNCSASPGFERTDRDPPPDPRKRRKCQSVNCQPKKIHTEKEARDLQMNLIDGNNAVTVRWGIPGLKAAMEMIGLYGGAPRPPLLPTGEADREELRKILTRTGFFPQPKV